MVELSEARGLSPAYRRSPRIKHHGDNTCRFLSLLLQLAPMNRICPRTKTTKITSCLWRTSASSALGFVASACPSFARRSTS